MVDANLADSTEGRELVVVIEQRLGYCEFIGTRATLEMEGLAPPDGEWPEGFDSTRWQAERFDYWLRRQRPAGAKGPRRDFANCDWWCMRIELTDEPTWEERDIRRKERELSEARYFNSYEGRQKRSAALDRYWAAHGDKPFQEFLKLCPGLLPKQRGRRRKSDSKTKAN